MRFLVASIAVVWLAVVVHAEDQTEPAPAASEEQKPMAAALYGADAEQKANDDGYDFFSIDQLFLNNPQYAKLLSDLQAHTFGSNWRRKRDVGDEEPPAETPVETPEETSPTSPIAEITEVTKDMRETAKETSEAVENIEGRTTPLKASSSISTTTTSSFGFSGSTERAHEEPTSAAPVRSTITSTLTTNPASSSSNMAAAAAAVANATNVPGSNNKDKVSDLE
ncbi:AAEL001045-PA [Aedes aegypti]|uniref:AAEL001045-PA n=1 Tax=Aedes aegypti TaxID=7159 RepID=Q17ME3_AEDAE|nr:AAEL001045-PA [Aedes aegypti]